MMTCDRDTGEHNRAFSKLKTQSHYSRVGEDQSNYKIMNICHVARNMTPNNAVDKCCSVAALLTL